MKIAGVGAICLVVGLLLGAGSSSQKSEYWLKATEIHYRDGKIHNGFMDLEDEESTSVRHVTEYQVIAAHPLQDGSGWQFVYKVPKK